MKFQSLVIALFAVGTIGLRAAEGTAPAPDSKADQPVFVGGIGAPTGMGRPDIIGKWKSWMLKESIDITTAQMWQVEVIYTNEWVDIQALGRPPLRDRAEVNRIHRRAFEQVRVILTPEQRAKFNLLPQHLGGGLTTRSPWDRVDQLDKLVHLSAAQKEQALSVYIAATEELEETGAGTPSAQLFTINRTMRRMIRSILTPGQQAIWQVAPQTKGGGSMVPPAKIQLARLNRIVHLTDDQKPAALKIIQDAYAVLVRIPEDDMPTMGAGTRAAMRTQIRAILTPEQQTLLDASQRPHGD